MSFQSLVKESQKHFPKLQIKYKDQSYLMKILGMILFFNKNFMTSYATTIGSTVYFPSESFVERRGIYAEIIFLHELVHVNDSQKYGKFIFGFLYMSPQILAVLCLPLLFISWKIALILIILFAIPIPSFFRMHFEKRGYMVSLYALNEFGNKFNFDPELDKHCKDYSEHFKNSTYYFMWNFKSIDKELKQAAQTIQDGNKPFEDPIFFILDDLIKSA